MELSESPVAHANDTNAYSGGPSPVWDSSAQWPAFSAPLTPIPLCDGLKQWGSASNVTVT